MHEEFYAVVKLVSGEEIFGIVSPTKENDVDYLIIYEPIIILPLTASNNAYYYKVEPWLKLSKETLFIIEKSKIITVNESDDKDYIKIYKRYINSKGSKDSGNYKLNKNEGYIDNVKNVREMLEKIYQI
jgi:fructose-1,6-bisphosphatase